MSNCIFVTGTDTDSGKTLVSSLVIKALAGKGLQTTGFKPLATGGNPHNADALCLQAASNMDIDYDMVNPFCFAPAIAPHIAAAQAGLVIEMRALDNALHTIQASQAQYLVIEGAGGWCLPVNDHLTLDQWVARHKMPVILVVGMKLGCLNHALLTEAQLKAQGVHCLGWVANQLSAQPMPYYQENLAYLQGKLSAPLLFELPYFNDLEQAQLSPSQLTALFTAIGCN